ncbi:MAG: hypothetical protein P4K83_05125 [Terracidiphilus sp.]|nr:hypothetical protein [Terracidiphilus sp.]
MSGFAQSSGNYTLRLDKPQQTIKGLGVEIQSDSIGSGNAGMPDEVVAVPHDLTPEERTRFYTEMLHGFRYVRLAMGLYLRGTDADQKHIVERYAGQMDDLRALQDVSGVEGFDVEYWSPAPYWKEEKSYYGGTISGHDAVFIRAFSDALVEDLRYLQVHGLHIAQWGLQNEPVVGHMAPKDQVKDDGARQSYGTCAYAPEDYANVLAVAAPKVRALLPHVEIHAPSWDGPAGEYAAAIRRKPELLSLIDAWTWHQIGNDSNAQIDKQAWYMRGAGGKPVYSNEFEYQPWDKPGFNSYFMNTGQSLMNWMVFENSPTWYWLHALKPVTNMEAGTYALGFWRPLGQLKQNLRPGIKPGHWDFDPENWNAVSGFVRYLGWDAVRYQVDEDHVRYDQRIMAWRRKDGRMAIALSNRGSAPFTFHLRGLSESALEGHLYTVAVADKPLGARMASQRFDFTVQPQSFEFWIAPALQTVR